MGGGLKWGRRREEIEIGVGVGIDARMGIGM